MALLRLLAAFVVGLAATAAEAQEPLREEPGFLRVQIDGRGTRLETLIVRPDHASGRRPLALITHGKAPSHAKMSDLRAVDYAGVARDLARRGWIAAVVVRRGFGQSDGPFSAEGAGCGLPNMVQRFENEAKELEAALKALTERPDVDPDRIIALGQSAGGAAVMALAQRKPPGLKAVINLAGGLDFGDCVEKGRDALVATVRHWPWKDTIPQLWVYAGNDELFPPPVVDRMRAAALDRGGDVRFIALPEIKPSGHAVLLNTRARFVWLPEMDTSLRAWKLPTLPAERPQSEFERLGLQGRASVFEGYFSAPGEKVMAVSRTAKAFSYRYGTKDLETARRNALSECGKKAADCRTAFENDRAIVAP
ncbi:alpha/beta hydrolase family protein [Bosea sp. BH3]|uniref:alpha/beta hydrolase family protein n=1 Tax=Bosea sp. BH3 TaxID=2871701 RepID=UPI0021CB14AD|nr:CocE/NonD family hydrolase [Bosea sp. BH3]MCU4182276.1 alpha/beta hydrolase [Bosea sp. BH3]